MPGNSRKRKPDESTSQAATELKPSLPSNLPNRKTGWEEEALILGADVLSQIKDVVFAFDHEFRIIYWNKAAELQYGYSADEVLGRVVTDVIPYRWLHPEDEEACAQSLRTSGSWRGEVIQFNRQGKEIFVEGLVSVLNRPERPGPIYLAINRDATERKRVEAALRHAQADLEARIRDRTTELVEANRRLREEIAERKGAEAALRESEQRLHSILESSPSIVFLKDVEGRYLYVNPQFRKLCRSPRGEVIGKNDRELFPEGQAQAFRTNDLHVLQARAPMEFEEVSLQSDGLHTSLVTKFPLMDTRGEVNAIAGIVTDITERILAEQALCEANAILKRQAQLLDLAHDAIIVRDLNGVITFWNRGAERAYGWPKQEALGKCIYELLQTTFPIPREEFERRILSEGFWDGELIHVRRDGERITVATHQAVQRDEKGEPLAILGINRDISRQKQAELALRELSGRLLQKQDEERRVVARELHDSTSPSFTMLLSKLYQARKRSQELDPGVFGTLSDSVALAESLAREITTVSYLLHPPHLDGEGFNAALAWYLEGYVRRTGIKVETDLPSGPMRLPKESEMVFFRIVQEALTNILRHSGTPAAKVRLSSNPKQVKLEVSDQGRGIPAHVLERWRAGDITELGVGITGMRERLRQLGGYLEIESSAQGTVIRAVLPVRA